MRIPPSLRSFLLVAPALLVAACSGSTAVEPVVTIGGWSWAPDEAGDRPLPVLWVNGPTPQRLPLPAAGNCPSSGSVQALAPVRQLPVAGGIAVQCNDGEPTLLPVVWPDTTTLQVQQLPPRVTQGTVMAVAYFDGSLYAAGAVGFQSPEPAVWVNGRLKTIEPRLFIPPGHDAALITAVVPTERYVLATGIAHMIDSDPPRFTAVGWVFDPEFRDFTYEPLFVPSGTDAVIGPAVYLVVLGDVAIPLAGIVSPAGADKTLGWFNDDVFSPFGLDFTEGPFVAPTSLALVSSSPYSSGWVRTPSASSRPQPAIFAVDPATALGVLDVLPTVDDATALGAGEGLAIFNDTAFVVGESCQPHPTSRALLVCPPSFWANGGRGVLDPLVPAGGVLPLTEPVFGWWRVPGTPSTSPPDWPFPGGFPEILRGGAVAAGGSAVGRAVIAVPAGG